MFIECDCSIEGGEGAEAGQTKLRKAQKPHICVECKRTIKPGEQYEYTTGCWEGRWRTYKTCRGCLLIREHLSSSGWIYGHLAEAVEECIGFNYVTGREQ